MTAATKRRLDEAAVRSGRSQSQEAELRLEQSFELERRFGGPEMVALVIAKLRWLRAAERADEDLAGDAAVAISDLLVEHLDSILDAAEAGVRLAEENARLQPFEEEGPDAKRSR